MKAKPTVPSTVSQSPDFSDPASQAASPTQPPTGVVQRPDAPHIYVASLADYNAGRLVGRWIDADQDTDTTGAAGSESCVVCGQAVAGKAQAVPLHFMPTSSSWLNMMERWLGEIARKRIRRGTFKSVPQLIEAIVAYLHQHNQDPKPFVWTKDADMILARIDRCKDASGTAPQRLSVLVTDFA